jgi:hypothetical protein
MDMLERVKRKRTRAPPIPGTEPFVTADESHQLAHRGLDASRVAVGIRRLEQHPV